MERQVKWLFGTRTCKMSSSSTSVKDCSVCFSHLQLHCFEYFIVCVWMNFDFTQTKQYWGGQTPKRKEAQGDWQHAYSFCHEHLSNRAAKWHQNKGWHGWINLLFQRGIRKWQFLEMVSWQQPISSKPSTSTTNLFYWIWLFDPHHSNTLDYDLKQQLSTSVSQHGLLKIEPQYSVPKQTTVVWKIEHTYCFLS